MTEGPPNPPSNLGAFQIVISPGAGLAANPAALAAFNRAADAWEARISDPIVVTLNADLGSLPNGVIGSTGSVSLQAGYNTIRDQLVSNSAVEPDDTIVASLPTAAGFTAFVPVGASLSANVTATKANLKAMGFAGLDASFGVSDGTITFSNTFAFDFDNSNGVGANLLDFETVGAHEIGHALGFVSIVDSVNAGLANGIRPVPLDLYRFSNNVAGEDPATTANFTSFSRNLIPGEDTVSDFILDSNSEFRMSTGVASSFPGVDGNQASHWKADDITGTLIGLMDPTLSNGQFYGPQESDFRAMDLIGYDIVAAPEPTTMSFLLLGAVTFGAVRSRHRR